MFGEVYEIDDKMLHFADEFEGHPEVYQRDRILVTLYDDPAENQRPSWPPGGNFSNPNESFVSSIVNAARQTNQSNQPTQNSDGACAENGRTIECWVYFLKHVRPSMLELPCYENYSSSNLENMEYDTR